MAQAARIDETVDRHVREAAILLAERDTTRFWGSVTTDYQDGRLVGLKITETVKAK